MFLNWLRNKKYIYSFDQEGDNLCLKREDIKKLTEELKKSSKKYAYNGEVILQTDDNFLNSKIQYLIEENFVGEK